MSASALSFVWNVSGVTAEEKLVLLWMANSSSELGYPASSDWCAMGDFIGADFEHALEVVYQLRGKGLVHWPDEGGEIWIAYDGLYQGGFDFSTEPKRRSKRLLAVIERDGAVCRYCRRESVDYHLDHFIPKCRGGADALANLVLACPTCNMSKGGKLPEEWQFLQERPELIAAIRRSLEVE